MSPIRVLVVDDSVVARRMITDVLEAEPGIEVAGTASNGRIAIAKIAELSPDVVILDIVMPEMDGLGALREIRRGDPRLPVIMFSSLTEAGAAPTIEALSLGASDYVAKPSNASTIGAAMEVIRDQLIPKVHALSRHGGTRRVLPAARPPMRPALHRPDRPASGPSATPARSVVAFGSGAGPDPAGTRGARRVDAVDGRPPAGGIVRRHAGSSAPRVDAIVIGSSTGGPKALAVLWSGLPVDLPVPILITQHMPPTFTTLLAERMTRLGRLPVVEARDGIDLRPGIALLAPGDRHMVLEENVLTGRVRLTQDPPVHSCRPAVDPLFTSAARVFGSSLLAVVLTGMGNDGTEGCAYVAAGGGQVIVQDEETSTVWGMPGSVARVGLADAIVPLEDIAAEITQRVGHGRDALGLEARAG